MKRLKFNGRVLVKIYDNDTQVDTGEAYGDTYDLDSHLMHVIHNNLLYDNIAENSELEWDSDVDEQYDSLEGFVERQKDLWEDLQTIEQECLSGNETLVEWLQQELLTVVNLLKKEKGE